MIATNNEELEIDKLLVEYGANVNHENNEGKTALIRALGVLKFETIKFPIEKGANVNHTDNDARTALFYASKRKDCGTLEIFIANGVFHSISQQSASGIENSYSQYKYFCLDPDSLQCGGLGGGLQKCCRPFP